MFYLIYDHKDPKQTFEFLQPIGSDIKTYKWFNLKTLDEDYDYDGDNLDNMDLAGTISGTSWQVIATFEVLPTADELRTFIESSPELFL